MTKQEFIKLFAGYATKAYEKEKIVPSLIIAQAILESGWGTSELSKKANNYFGLNNYHDSVTNEYSVYKMTAPQEYNGKLVYKEEEFCLFKDVAECVECMYKWYNRSKYAKLHTITDYKEACKFVKDAGYATDSGYTNKLINIIGMYELYNYDKEVMQKATPSQKVTYYVQAGAYNSEINARCQKEKLAKDGFKSLIKYDGSIYRVQVGAYSIKANADHLVKQLNDNGYSAFVTNNIAGKEV